MPRTTTVDCPGCPPFRVLTFDALGLIKVVEARDKQVGVPQVVDRWGEPDSSKCISAVSITDRKAEPLLAIARKNGRVEILNPVNGDLQAAMLNANESDIRCEENAFVGLHLFAKQNLELPSRSCTLLTCTTKGNTSIKTIEAASSSAESISVSSSTLNVCAGGSISCCKVDGSEKYALFGGMGSTENKLIYDLKENILHIFKDFMTGIAKIDELGTAGSKLLIGFQHALEYIRRPPIDRTFELINKVIEANETKRVKMYIEAGCRNPLDGIQNVNKMNSCKLGLLDHISKAKVILEELEGLLGNVGSSIQSTSGNVLHILDQASIDELTDHAIYNDLEMALFNSQHIDVTHLATLIGLIYSMVKQDYLMQEKIVSALNLKSSSGELESYCLMWSLRPFINDDVMHQAWRLIS